MQTTDVAQPISTKFSVLVPAQKLQESWNWLVTNISDRPKLAEADTFVFDHKKLGTELALVKYSDVNHVETITSLYLASQFCADPNEIIAVVNNEPTDVGVFTQKIETAIHKLIDNYASFPNALSEHMAFWTQVATFVRTRLFPTLIVSLPNTLPTDPGPDGLSLAFDSKNRMIVEIRSVKSSINKPNPLISTPSFRSGGDAKPDKQLEEFYLVATTGYGFVKLDKLLSGAFASIGKPTDKFVRAGLLQNSSKFNAVVVANSNYSSSKLFNGYERIPRLAKDRVATYIGADEWEKFAENVRTCVIETVQAAGVY